MPLKMEKKSQVWVETVIYTLIGIVLIGTVLALATPFINEQKDKAIIERTTNSLNQLDNVIINIKNLGVGNKREFNFLIGKGTMTIDGERDEIIFRFDESNYKYSEELVTIDISGTNLKARTGKSGKKFNIVFSLNYRDKVNITYNGEDISKTFSYAPNPYKFIIENKGKIPSTISCSDSSPCSEPYLCSGGKCIPKFSNINIIEIS
ncbi:MAG: hypothetical protein QXH60_02485 [Candidatus Pacearchaeota archaeon]